MLMPIGDDNRDRRLTPVLNYVFIALNIVVFVLFQKLGANDLFTYAYATVPVEIMTGRDVARPVPIQDDQGGEAGVIPHQRTPLTPYLTLLTSMFLHGSLAHLFGNMLYLWIFGDNLEDRFGRERYLVFYLTTGILASLAHVFATVALGGNQLIPSLGASGAIAGVLGGYFVLFPRRRVRVLMLRTVTEVPAIAAIGLWFVFQLFAGVGDLRAQGGVAYAAHVGGFIAGVVLVKLFDPGARGLDESRQRRTI